MATATKAGTTTQGTLLVEGQQKFNDETSLGYLSEERTQSAVCRHGCSTVKPACDGTHRRSSFVLPRQPMSTAMRYELALAVWEGEGGSRRESQ